MGKRTNYERGVEVERKIIHQLEKEGYVATRSAGSHSKFDIWAFNHLHTLLIQSKRCKVFNESFYQEELNQIKEIAKRAPLEVQIEFWVWLDKKGFIRQDVIKASGELYAEL